MRRVPVTAGLLFVAIVEGIEQLAPPLLSEQLRRSICNRRVTVQAKCEVLHTA